MTPLKFFVEIGSVVPCEEGRIFPSVTKRTSGKSQSSESVTFVWAARYMPSELFTCLVMLSSEMSFQFESLYKVTTFLRIDAVTAVSLPPARFSYFRKLQNS